MALGRWKVTARGRDHGTNPSTLVVTIEGYDLPGRSCHPAGAAGPYENIQVGVQRRDEVVSLVPGDADRAVWSLPVTVRTTQDGEVDFGGPFVHGRRGGRFLYLNWGSVTDEFRMFRRAKLHFADCGVRTLRDALRSGELICRVQMSDRCGDPVCARVRAPAAQWSAPRGRRADGRAPA